MVNSLDSIDTSKEPCYVFVKIEIGHDSAYVHMVLDLTNTLVFGKLYHDQGQWIPDPNFLAGIR